MNQTLDYLYGLERFGIKLGLEVITELLELLGNPQNEFKSIHLAGTNGKGSTANFIYSILKEAGYKVGLYTSPHLVKFNERIKINNQEISDSELVELTKLIKEKIAKTDLQPTFFEFTTALAFLHFAKKKVDYVVVETGLGGRLDATNVLNPIVSVITNISLDHTQYLGETKLEIAREKAAIIKKNNLVVTGENDPPLLDLFKKVCLEKNSKLFILDKIGPLKIKLLGKHQLKNASLAKKVIEVSKITVSQTAIKQGLLKAKWAGRLQVVNEKPSVILDGAHNVCGMIKLKEFLIDLFKEQKFIKKILVLGMAKDKEIEKSVSLIIPFFDQIILTQGNFKPAPLDLLEKEMINSNPMKLKNKKIIKINHPQQAMEKAATLAQKEDFVLVTGSLYLIGDILKYVINFNKLFKGK